MSRITIANTVLHQPLDDETVLLHLTTETYYGLDDIGTRVWQLLGEHGEIDPVVASIVDEYGADEAVVRTDIERFVGELAEAGLIEVAQDTGP
jgi:hypothetical protein